MLSACSPGGLAAWNPGSNHLSVELQLRWLITYLWAGLGTESQHHSCLDMHKLVEHHKLTAGCPEPILPFISTRDLSVQGNTGLALESELSTFKEWAGSFQRNKPQEAQSFATHSPYSWVSMQESCFRLPKMKVKCYIDTCQVANLSLIGVQQLRPTCIMVLQASGRQYQPCLLSPSRRMTLTGCKRLT